MPADMSNAIAKGGKETGGEDSDHEAEMVPDMALAEAVFRVLALRSLGECSENETLAVIDKCKEKVRMMISVGSIGCSGVAWWCYDVRGC